MKSFAVELTYVSGLTGLRYFNIKNRVYQMYVAIINLKKVCLVIFTPTHVREKPIRKTIIFKRLHNTSELKSTIERRYLQMNKDATLI